MVFSVLPGLAGSFSSANDAQIPAWLKTPLVNDREGLLRADAFRSAVFILLSAIVLWAFVEKKLKVSTSLLLLGALILIDQWSVDKRYLNNDNFVSEREAQKPFNASAADLGILKDKAPDFRVLNVTISTFNDASTSYFHKSIGGYHGAKMRRYQELIDHQISKEMQQISQKLSKVKSATALDSVFLGCNALNMLNTKYLIYNPNAAPLPNTHALGSAWLVDDYKIVDNADQEIAAIGQIDPSKEVVVNKKFGNDLTGLTFKKDTTAIISLTSYSPNKLEYNFRGTGNHVAVFSEIYYPKGWNAYLDGKNVPYFQADYVLRAMAVPAGNHKIEFRFEPKSFMLGSTVSSWSSVILLLLLIGIFVKEIIPAKEK